MVASPSKSHLEITQLSQTIEKSRCLPYSLPIETVKSLPDATPGLTDGSILRNRVGFADLIGNKTSSCRHWKTASILTAQLQAIFQCLEEIFTLPLSHPQYFLICTDSLSSLTAISNTYSAHRLIDHVLSYTFSTIKVTITFIWVPSHRGIQENEQAATNLPRTSSPLERTYLDLSTNKHSDFGLRIGRAKLPQTN